MKIGGPLGYEKYYLTAIRYNNGSRTSTWTKSITVASGVHLFRSGSCHEPNTMTNPVIIVRKESSGIFDGKLKLRIFLRISLVVIYEAYNIRWTLQVFLCMQMTKCNPIALRIIFLPLQDALIWIVNTFIGAVKNAQNVNIDTPCAMGICWKFSKLLCIIVSKQHIEQNSGVGARHFRLSLFMDHPNEKGQTSRNRPQWSRWRRRINLMN